MYEVRLYHSEDLYFEDPMLLFDDTLIDLRVKVVEPTLTLEDNAAGSLEFAIYPENHLYSDDPDPEISDGGQTSNPTIKMLSGTIKVFRDGKEIWEGRPTNCESGFFNDHRYHVEGALSYLNDIPQPTKEYVPKPGEDSLKIVDFIKGVLIEYNRYASANRQFDINSVYCYPQRENNLLGIDEQGSTEITLGGGRVTGGETTFETLSKLVSEIGGHIKVASVTKTIDGKPRTVRTIMFTAMHEPEYDFIGDHSGQSPYIKYGVNLIELTRTIDCTGVVTAILPVGAEISPDKPETILTMCEPVQLEAYGRSTNLEDPNLVTCYDSVQWSSVWTHDPKIDREVFGAKFGGSGYQNGYDYFLFTTTSVHEPSNWDSAKGYSHYFEDISKQSGYPNARILSREKLKYTTYDRTTTTGKLFSVPDVGRYNLMFSCGVSYASYTKVDGTPIKGRVLSTLQLPSNADVGDAYYCVADKKYYQWGGDQWSENQNAEDWILSPQPSAAELSALQYPLLLRAPYKRDEYHMYNITRVPDRLRMWIGASSAGNYGINDTDVAQDNTGGDAFGGYIRIVYGNEWGSESLPQEKQPPGWQEGYAWTHGFFGRKLCRVLVEPGRTYYLNTRVTNPGYPIYDPSDPYASIGPGGVITGTFYNNVFSYMIVARKRHVDVNDPNLVIWKWEALSYKQVSNDRLTNILDMEKIVIPDGIYPEDCAKIDDGEGTNIQNGNVVHFYNASGDSLDDNTNDIVHLELWFSCDQVYFGENLSADHYMPDIFIEDKKTTTEVISNAETEHSYKNRVTVAPVNNTTYPIGSPYADLPREMLVNQALADKYGLIIRYLEYSDVTNPTELMRRARIYMSLLRNQDALELTAMDLETCGITGYRAFTMYDRFAFISEPHPGVDGRYVTLTGMTIALDDQSKNAYSFGYDSSKDLSAIAAANGGSDV